MGDVSLILPRDFHGVIGRDGDSKPRLDLHLDRVDIAQIMILEELERVAGEDARGIVEPLNQVAVLVKALDIDLVDPSIVVLASHLVVDGLDGGAGGGDGGEKWPNIFCVSRQGHDTVIVAHKRRDGVGCIGGGDGGFGGEGRDGKA